MNKLLHNIFLWFFPFFALWVFLFRSAHLNIFPLLTIFFAPFAIYIFSSRRVRVPTYLLFLIIFTIYHLYSVFANNLVPSQTNGLFYVLGDSFVSASIILFIVENMVWEDWFITKLNRHIFFIVVIALIVSIIQIKDVTFFIDPEQFEDVDKMDYFFDNHRNYSIFSWVDLNSLGVTFPILIAILLNYYEEKKIALFILILSTVLVCFLSQTRYTMISGIIVLAHLIITASYSSIKKMSILIVLIVSVLGLSLIGNMAGINIQQKIDERIMEKDVNIDESSAGARIKSYEVFILKFPEHPWFGVGPQTRPDVAALLGEGIPIIHVGYLSYLYYYGIAGCFFFFFSLFFLLRSAFIVGWRYKFWGSFYGLLAFCLANATMVYFAMNEAGIILAALYIRYHQCTETRLKNESHEFDYTEVEPVS